jgi:hypothetical protein
MLMVVGLQLPFEHVDNVLFFFVFNEIIYESIENNDNNTKGKANILHVLTKCRIARRRRRKEKSQYSEKKNTRSAIFDSSSRSVVVFFLFLFSIEQNRTQAGRLSATTS